MFDDFVSFVKDIYGTSDHIPLHAPIFDGNEKNTSLKQLTQHLYPVLVSL